MEAFETFFDVLDNDLDDFGSIVTDDFYIFENSRMGKEILKILLLKQITILPTLHSHILANSE